MSPRRSAAPIQVQVSIPSGQRELLAADWVRRVAVTTLEAEDQRGVRLAVTLTDDQGIRALNNTYRGIDRPTDVLAFAMSEGPAFIVPSSEPRDLGDVVISLPRAQCQAAEHHTSLQGEVALLVVHGCLHLLGYDHAEDEEQQRMWARQAAILATIG